MEKRISHQKSRRGCQSCKRKHVKCDEQGPPCANCVVRKLECVYAPPPESRVKKKRAKPLVRRPKPGSPQLESAIDSQGQRAGSTATSSEPSLSSSSANGSSTALTIGPRNALSTPSPSVFAGISESDRLLELELFHRWSTRSWTGLYSVPGDQEYLQVIVPQSALKSSYLMDGIFAMSAADLSRHSQGKESTRYFRAALEYGNKASEEFRSELSNINEENLHLLYHFTMMAAIFNFVVPAGRMTVMDRFSIIFDMVLGGTSVAYTNLRWLYDSPCGFRKAMEHLPEIIMLDLDPETHVELDRLRTVCRRIRLPPQGDKTGDPFASEVDMYQLSIAQLRSCFCKEAGNRVNAYWLTFITMAGPKFSQAVKEYEPIALFILMHYGVVLERSKSEPMHWWIASTGQELVRDISQMLLYTPIAQIPEGRAGIRWTREQVGLPPLSGLEESVFDEFTNALWDVDFEQGPDFDPDSLIRNIYLEAIDKSADMPRIKEEYLDQ